MKTFVCTSVKTNLIFLQYNIINDDIASFFHGALLLTFVLFGNVWAHEQQWGTEKYTNIQTGGKYIEKITGACQHFLFLFFLLVCNDTASEHKLS